MQALCPHASLDTCLSLDTSLYARASVHTSLSHVRLTPLYLPLCVCVCVCVCVCLLHVWWRHGSVATRWRSVTVVMVMTSCTLHHLSLCVGVCACVCVVVCVIIYLFVCEVMCVFAKKKTHRHATKKNTDTHRHVSRHTCKRARADTHTHTSTHTYTRVSARYTRQSARAPLSHTHTFSLTHFLSLSLSHSLSLSLSHSLSLTHTHRWRSGHCT
jgi:hypothetical protein